PLLSLQAPRRLSIPGATAPPSPHPWSPATVSSPTPSPHPPPPLPQPPPPHPHCRFLAIPIDVFSSPSSVALP
ncbi:Os06g0273100, partial [Oryza sativa Japonica Group]